MSLSEDTRQAVFAQSTDARLAALLTITAEELDEPVRLTDYGADLSRDGNTYRAIPIDMDLPSDDGESVQRVELVVDNVHREMTRWLRATVAPPIAELEVVLVTDDNLITELGPMTFELREPDIDAATVRGELITDPILAMPVTKTKVTPQTAPGAFR